MTEYTPTTEQVRNAYVRGLRDMFIASAGEHYDEFDRWVQAHDDEVRALMQPPTREQIAEAIYTARAGSNKNWHKAAFRDDYLEQADAVLALFPQPTPVIAATDILARMWQAYAEQQCGWQDAASYHGHTRCSRAGVGAAGLVFEESISQLRDMLPTPTADHFQSKQEAGFPRPTQSAEHNYLADELEALIPEVRRTARPGHGGSSGKYAESVMRSAVEALRAQPESTAERFATAIASTVHDTGASFFDALESAEPPSIADMAPETCDECGGTGVCGGPPDRYYDCPRCSGEPVDLDDTRDDRDPSTIRDVNPPKGNDRG